MYYFCEILCFCFPSNPSVGGHFEIVVAHSGMFIRDYIHPVCVCAAAWDGTATALGAEAALAKPLHHFHSEHYECAHPKWCGKAEHSGHIVQRRTSDIHSELQLDLIWPKADCVQSSQMFFLVLENYFFSLSWDIKIVFFCIICRRFATKSQKVLKQRRTGRKSDTYTEVKEWCECGLTSVQLPCPVPPVGTRAQRA